MEFQHQNITNLLESSAFYPLNTCLMNKMDKKYFKYCCIKLYTKLNDNTDLLTMFQEKDQNQTSGASALRWKTQQESECILSISFRLTTKKVSIWRYPWGCHIGSHFGAVSAHNDVFVDTLVFQYVVISIDRLG